MAPSIDNVRIPQALQALLRYRPSALDNLQFSEAVVPTIEVLPLAAESQTDGITLNLAAGAGTFVAGFTVPATEFWKLINLHRAASTGASEVRLVPQGAASGAVLVASSTAAAALMTGSDGYMYPGDQLGMLTTGNGADTSIEIRVWYMRFRAQR